MRGKAAVVMVAVLVGMALSACSDSEDPEALAIELTQTGGAPGIVGPTSSDTGLVEVSFKNSAQAPANLEVLRVEDEHTSQEVLAVLGSEGSPIPEWLSAGGGVGAVPPGQTRTATLTLDQGKYVMIAMLDTEGESEAPPATADFEVTGDGDGSLPSTDGTITARDYSFEAEGLEPGENEITFRNDGPNELHHLEAFPMVEGATVDQVKAFLTTEGEPTGPPPLDFEAGTSTAVVDPNDELVTTVNLRPGRYAFICFISDRAGGPPHAFANNMISEITVAP